MLKTVVLLHFFVKLWYIFQDGTLCYFDAKLSQLNQLEKKVTVYFYAFSSKANFQSPLKTYLAIDNVEDIDYIIVNMPKK